MRDFPLVLIKVKGNYSGHKSLYALQYLGIYFKRNIYCKNILQERRIAMNLQKKLSISFFLSLSNYYFFILNSICRSLFYTRKIVENVKIDFYIQSSGDIISNLARISHLSGTSCYASHSRVFFITSQDL